jgi:hypothetical protein
MLAPKSRTSSNPLGWGRLECRKYTQQYEAIARVLLTITARLHHVFCPLSQETLGGPRVVLGCVDVFEE